MRWNDMVLHTVPYDEDNIEIEGTDVDTDDITVEDDEEIIETDILTENDEENRAFLSPEEIKILRNLIAIAPKIIKYISNINNTKSKKTKEKEESEEKKELEEDEKLEENEELEENEGLNRYKSREKNINSNTREALNNFYSSEMQKSNVAEMPDNDVNQMWQNRYNKKNNNDY